MQQQSAQADRRSLFRCFLVPIYCATKRPKQKRPLTGEEQALPLTMLGNLEEAEKIFLEFFHGVVSVFSSFLLLQKLQNKNTYCIVFAHCWYMDVYLKGWRKRPAFERYKTSRKDWVDFKKRFKGGSCYVWHDDTTEALFVTLNFGSVCSLWSCLQNCGDFLIGLRSLSFWRWGLADVGQYF